MRGLLAGKFGSQEQQEMNSDAWMQHDATDLG